MTGASGGTGRPDTNLLATLREATKTAHHRIDHHPLLTPLVRPELTGEHYCSVLKVMAWVHGPLHACFLSALTRFGLDPAGLPSDRPAWLKEDFSWHGLDDGPLPDALAGWRGPSLKTPAALVGALYVIEGSTLGGQVIAKQLEQSLHVGPGRGATFFNGHGAGTLAHWDTFARFAASTCPIEKNDEACAAAAGLFGDIERMLNVASQHLDVIAAA